MSFMEYKKTHLQDIEDINKCFSNRKLLKKCIYRFDGSVPIKNYVFKNIVFFLKLEQIRRIELPSLAWKAKVLPLN